MTDQCKHCIARGDLANCRATPCDLRNSWYAMQQNAEIERLTDVDRIAQIIRQVDGNNTLGAGALAEKIVEALREEE